jgi:hypothetical protein
VIPYHLGNKEKKKIYMFSTDTIEKNFFNLWLVESMIQNRWIQAINCIMMSGKGKNLYP